MGTAPLQVIKVLELDCKNNTHLTKIILRNHGTTSTPYVVLAGNTIVLILDESEQRPPAPDPKTETNGSSSLHQSQCTQTPTRWTNTDGS